MPASKTPRNCSTSGSPRATSNAGGSTTVSEASGARAAIAERSPHEATIPLDELAAAPFPKLVVSGAHHPAFDAICDVLERELRAERLVLPGHGHSVQRHPDFNAELSEFVDRAYSSTR